MKTLKFFKLLFEIFTGCVQPVTIDDFLQMRCYFHEKFVKTIFQVTKNELTCSLNFSNFKQLSIIKKTDCKLKNLSHHHHFKIPSLVSIPNAKFMQREKHFQIKTSPSWHQRVSEQTKNKNKPTFNLISLSLSCKNIHSLHAKMFSVCLLLHLNA